MVTQGGLQRPAQAGRGAAGARAASSSPRPRSTRSSATIRSRTHNYTFRLVPGARSCSSTSPGSARPRGSRSSRPRWPSSPAPAAAACATPSRVLGQLIAGSGPDGRHLGAGRRPAGRHRRRAARRRRRRRWPTTTGPPCSTSIERVVESGHDPRRFVTDLLERLRDLMVIHHVPARRPLRAPRRLRGPHRLAMVAQAGRFGPTELTRYAEVVSTALHRGARGAPRRGCTWRSCARGCCCPRPTPTEAGMRWPGWRSSSGGCRRCRAPAPATGCGTRVGAARPRRRRRPPRRRRPRPRRPRRSGATRRVCRRPAPPRQRCPTWRPPRRPRRRCVRARSGGPGCLSRRTRPVPHRREPGARNAPAEAPPPAAPVARVRPRPLPHVAPGPARSVVACTPCDQAASDVGPPCSRRIRPVLTGRVDDPAAVRSPSR